MSEVTTWRCVSGDGTVGAAKIWHCQDPAHNGEPEAVQLSLSGEGTTLQTVLTADDIRQLAAELLNFADIVDGETPLVFMPDCPTCTSDYPPGHPSRSTR